MKQTIKRSILSASVAIGLMAGAIAQADTVMAPFVVNDSGTDDAGAALGANDNLETYISLKTGTLAGEVHYYWIQKNWSDAGSGVASTGALEDMYNLTKPCRVTNSFGAMTPRDMLYQQLRGSFINNTNKEPATDASTASGFPTDFSGMLAIEITSALGTEEGNTAGFAYVVDAANGDVLDYKMINNHRSTKAGDFSAGFMAKKSIDYSWVPVTVATTEWYTAVMASDMTKGAESTPNSTYDATVLIGSDARVELDGTSNQFSPQDITLNSKGVFDNDENFLSGALDLNVTCAGIYDRSAFMNASQVTFTDTGGWTRRSITPVDTLIDAQGALTYKWETAVAGNPAGIVENQQSFIVETSGHLSQTQGTHANRPY